MTDRAPAVESSDRLSERGSMAHLLWFFALVYLVEGLGQIGGLIAQPLTYYLKQVQGWTPVQITAYLTLFNLPWIIKPLYGLVSDFIPLFGYRRKSYLLIANAAATCGFLLVSRLTVPDQLVFALMLTAYAMAISSTLCGAVLVENGQRLKESGTFHQPAMALVQRCSDDRRDCWWSTCPAACTNGRLAYCSRVSKRCSLACNLRNVVSHRREKGADEYSGYETYVRGAIDSISATPSVDHRSVHLPLLF
jgi:hypothetical protein